MAKPDAAAVANILRELGQRMELERRDPYRARAYARAAENLSLTLEPLDSLIKEGRLTEIPAIGDRIAAVITRIHHTGHHSGLDEVRQKVPASVLEMLRIPGLKPERVRKLHIELGIHSLAALEEAARTDRLNPQRLRSRISGEGPERH